VGDGRALGTGGLERANRRLPPRARAADEHLDRPHAVLHRPPRGCFRGDLRSERGRLAAALEALRARRSPGHDVALRVGDGDDGVVERALDVSLSDSHVFALAAARSYGLLLLLGQCLPARYRSLWA